MKGNTNFLYHLFNNKNYSLSKENCEKEGTHNSIYWISSTSHMELLVETKHGSWIKHGNRKKIQNI